MAKAFDPISEGATLAEGFDPIAEGAVLQEEKPSKKSFLNFNPAEAEKEFAKTQKQVLRESPYVVQGALYEPAKMANVLLNKKIPTPDVAKYLSPGLSPEEKKGAEEFGGMFGMGLPRAGILGGLKAAQGIPHVGKVLEQAMKASPILNKLFDIGGRGAEFGLYEAAQHPEDAGTRGALGFGLGAGISGLGYGLPAAARKFGFGKVPGQESIEGLTYEQVAPQVEAANRLGTPITPSEATLNPFISGIEARYPKTREASFRNVELGMERLGQEKKSINKLLRTIYDNSTASNNKIKSMYENIYKWNLKPNILNEIKKDPLISNAIDEVSKNPAWQRDLEGVSENNVAYLDRVKRALYDKERGLRKNAPSEAEQYKQARDNLVGVLDEAVPGYQEARQMSELKSTRKEIKKKMREEEVSGSNFYNRIIKNDDQYQNLRKKLRNNPDALSMLDDMKLAWRQLKNLPNIAQSAHQETANTGAFRNTIDKIQNIWKQMTGKKSNKKAVEFIRSDEWVNQLREAQKSGKKEDVENAANDIMMKVLPIGDFLLEENK